MGTLPQGNPRLPENINRSHEHPLPEFFKLLLAVMLGLALLAFAIGMLSHWLAPFVPFSWEASASVVVDEAVEDEFGDAEFEPHQQQALQTLGEKLLKADKAALQRKLDMIPEMEKEEVSAISRRYDDPVHESPRRSRLGGPREAGRTVARNVTCRGGVGAHSWNTLRPASTLAVSLPSAVRSMAHMLPSTTMSSSLRPRWNTAILPVECSNAT